MTRITTVLWLSGCLFIGSPLFSTAFLPQVSLSRHHPDHRPTAETHRHTIISTATATTVRKERFILSPLHSAVIEFIDPKTKAEVVLVGVFHGTKSSAQDVRTVMTASPTDVLVLELCASRFVDLQRQKENRSDESKEPKKNNNKNSKSWAERYTKMIVQTIQQRGLATGLAAALLSGFSGLQSSMSGFTPGLEFTTALELCSDNNDKSPSLIDTTTAIVLADQDVDETLRKLGDLPGSASEVFLWERLEDGQRQRRCLSSIWNECLLHATTVQQAIFGDSRNSPGIPQVHLPSALLRNKSAVSDLVRLALPSMMLMTFFSQTMAFAAMSATDNMEYGSNSMIVAGQWLDWPLTVTSNMDMSFQELIGHSIASAAIIGSGTLASIPVVKTILTERDEILATGIQEACQRAGKGGRVVAVLGLLHVNGVAKRMLQQTEVLVSQQAER
ncbi:TraB family protein [Nitzschia inconspicua]|uniref:TraB family protein n=1 Tax=Nitzschia inconspicua TaxID=303405 RepID=A0A9K3Q2Z0_9STRA|nr:TraB family protein [Nitzschia inconspicua]